MLIYKYQNSTDDNQRQKISTHKHTKTTYDENRHIQKKQDSNEERDVNRSESKYGRQKKPP